MNTIELCKWTFALGELLPKIEKLEMVFNFNNSTGGPRIVGKFLLHVGNVVYFDIILVRHKRGSFKPFLAIISEGPRSRYYYPVMDKYLGHGGWWTKDSGSIACQSRASGT